MDNWFEKVKSTLQKIGIIDRADLSSRLWNCDETGFCTATASKVVLARRGSRSVHEIGGGTGREFITVLGCGAADGPVYPHAFSTKAKICIEIGLQEDQPEHYTV